MIDFVTATADIQALKKFVDDPDGEDSLKLDLLAWMWYNRYNTINPKLQDKKYHKEVHTFLILTGTKE